MLNVFITRRIPDAGIQRLREAGLTVDVFNENRTIGADEFVERAQGHAALITILTDCIDAAVLDKLPALKIIAQYAVGFNNIDIAECTSRGIVVCNTPDVLTDATADMAWALMLAASRRIVEGDSFVRSGEWKGWEPLQMLGWQISGKTLGVIGFGRIGRAVARRAAGFDMRVAYCGRRRSDHERDMGATFVSLDELLAQSDFISVNCPLNNETCRMIGSEQFARMKEGAIFVNTARGQVVDEAALVDALQTGKIAAAGLDVYEEEPVIHPGLYGLGNVVLAPHLGSATHETRDKMAILCADNFLAYLKGKQPPTILNPDAMNK